MLGVPGPFLRRKRGADFVLFAGAAARTTRPEPAGAATRRRKAICCVQRLARGVANKELHSVFRIMAGCRL